MAKRPVTDDQIESLLHRLNSSDAGAAWACFVDRYSALIMHVILQFDRREDRAQECYLFACEALAADGFRRLQKFKVGGPAKFTTWLATVVYHLCVDWHRKEFGRAQLLPSFSALPGFDQEVYRLHFERGLSREECFQTLLDDMPDLVRSQVAEAVARLHRILTPRQRWLASLRLQRQHPSVHLDLDAFRAEGATPEDVAHRADQAERLERAMGSLPGEQQLILRLRYQEGLTLARIADTLRLGDPFRARRHVESALDALSRAVRHQRAKVASGSVSWKERPADNG